MTASVPPRVAVLGEALLDLFPERAVIGGAPFNVARNLALLGADPLMVTRIGIDPPGDDIAADFARFGLDLRGLQRDDVLATGTVRVHMDGTRHRFEIVANTAWDALDPAASVDAVQAAAPAIVYFGTLAQRSDRSRTAIRAAIDATRAARFLDLNLRDGPDNRTLAEESLGIAERVKVNDDELDRLIDWFIAPGEAPMPWGAPGQRAAIDALAQRFDLQRLVITRGGDGWACLDRATSSRWLEGRAPAVEVRDTVGAGDAFASILLLGDLRGWSLDVTLPRAAAFASSVCGLQGAVDPAAGIYRAALAEWQA